MSITVAIIVNAILMAGIVGALAYVTRIPLRLRGKASVERLEERELKRAA